MTQRHAEKLPDGRYRITVEPASELQVKAGSLELGADAYEAYCAWLDSHGAPIQNYLPDLTDDEREFLLSGLTPETYTQVFGGGPE